MGGRSSEAGAEYAVRGREAWKSRRRHCAAVASRPFVSYVRLGRLEHSTGSASATCWSACTYMYMHVLYPTTLRVAVALLRMVVISLCHHAMARYDPTIKTRVRRLPVSCKPPAYYHVKAAASCCFPAPCCRLTHRPAPCQMGTLPVWDFGTKKAKQLMTGSGPGPGPTAAAAAATGATAAAAAAAAAAGAASAMGGTLRSGDALKSAVVERYVTGVLWHEHYAYAAARWC